MNRMIALAGLVLAVVAVTFAGHFPAAFHHGAYAFHGYYPGKLQTTDYGVDRIGRLKITSTICLMLRLFCLLHFQLL